MKSSYGHIIFCLSWIMLTSASCGKKNNQQKETKQKPNIVFIFVDDLGYADVGFNGSTYYETPVIDKLAKESLVFDYSYMYPTCSPSRAALFTGKQSFRTGVYTVPVLEKGDNQENIFSRWTVGREHPIYSEKLAKVGYNSIHLGKWHIVGPYPEKELAMEFPLKSKLKQPKAGDFTWLPAHRKETVQKYYPEGRGFVQNVGGTFRGDPALEEGGYKSETGGYRAPFSNPFITSKMGDEWLTDRLTDDAMEFMGEHKDGPFLINLHYYAVHRPIKKRNDRLFNKFINKSVDSVTGQGIGKRKEVMAAYATMIASVDENIGRLVNFLEDNGLRENTIIVFSSDNGYNGGQSSNNNLRGSKGYIYEGGIRVPTFINWPGKVRARRTQAPISLLDYHPTFLKLAAVNDNDSSLDGNAITEIFQEDTPLFSERPLFWHLASSYKHGTCSVIRKNHYKLIQWLKDGKLELYDLKKDPKEEKNISENQGEITVTMLNELMGWRKKNKVPLPPNSILEY